ncbi:MAG: DNA repair exonuclease, partial [Armatimonadota bacterium]
MRIAHIADVHLGYRAYTRLTSTGLNRREVDVFKAFQSILDIIAERNPDVVVIAGDLFHTVRPSNFTIHQTYKLFANFRAVSAAPVVIVGGNHDTPKSSDTGCILDLYASLPGFHVHHHGFNAVSLPDLDAAVYCLPYFALEEREQYVLKPVDGHSVNVLAVHGTVQGVVRSRDPEVLQPKPSEFHFDEWDYAAFGHYHVSTELAPNAYFSGSHEYSSSNIWEECPRLGASPAAKGFIIYDTVARQAEFIDTPALRFVRDLPVINAVDLSAEEVMGLMAERLGKVPDGLQDKILRVVVEGFPRQLHKELDWAQLRVWKNEALHLDVVLRQIAAESSSGGRQPGGVAKLLEQEWADYAGSLVDVPRGVDRQRL